MAYNNNSKKIKKMVLLSSLTASAIILSIIESQLKIIPVPGAKLGLANLITIVVLMLFSFKDAALVTLFRILLIAVLSGNVGPTFFMGMSGGILALLVMGISKKLKLGIILLSLLGSLSHQIGQIFAGIYIIGANEIIYYLYIMLPIGVITGIINGIIAEKFILNLKNKNDIMSDNTW